MSGYHKDPIRTAGALAKGWFRTGDLGRMTPDGRLIIAGRIKDLINVAGEKVNPAEVENAAMSVPGVAEAAAFPAPDAQRGEVVALAVVLGPASHLTDKEILAVLKKQLSRIETPKHVFIRDALPVNAGGKVLRGELAAQCLRNLNGSTDR